MKEASHHALKTISGSQETVKDLDDRQQLPDDVQLTIPDVERKFLHQMSSGFATTQQSKDDPNESLELQTFGPINTILDSDSHFSSANYQLYDDNYLQYQNALLNRSCRQSVDEAPLIVKAASHYSMIKVASNQKLPSASSSSHIRQLAEPYPSSRQLSSKSSPPDKRSVFHSPILASRLESKNRQNSLDFALLQRQQQQVPVRSKHGRKRSSMSSPPSTNFYNAAPAPASDSISNSSNSNNNYSDISKQLRRLSSNQSINTLSLEQDELLNQTNLKDELLNCDQKELFQFLNEDFDNYFSDTVGYGTTLIDQDTSSLITPTNNKLPFADRKTSNGSLRSNISSISNSIFQVLESRRGGSLNGSTDKVYPVTNIPTTRSNILMRQESDEREPLVKQSEFDDIIQDFDTELKSLKSLSFERKSTIEIEDDAGPSYIDGNNLCSSNQNVVDSVVFRNKPERASNNALKRRSLEKQNKVSDEEFNMHKEMKKICDQLQAPYEKTAEIKTSPVMRRKNEFHNSFDRIKRYSLIERVEELNEEERPLRVFSERLPRKQLSKDKLETISLKSNLSDENVSKLIPIKSTPKFKESRELQKTFLHDPSNLSQLLKKSVQIHVQPLEGKEAEEVVEKPKTKAERLAEMTGKPWHCLVSYVDDLTVGGRKNSQGEYDDPETGLGFGKEKPEKIPLDCFPKQCYERCSCWEEMLKTRFGQNWMKVRTVILSFVDTPVFEWFILVLIFASSVTLCFEDIYLDKNQELKRILYWTNFGFCIIFVIEMFLKWIALGFTKYFSSFWTILDFIIVFVSCIFVVKGENY